MPLAFILKLLVLTQHLYEAGLYSGPEFSCINTVSYKVHKQSFCYHAKFYRKTDVNVEKLVNKYKSRCFSLKELKYYCEDLIVRVFSASMYSK